MIRREDSPWPTRTELKRATIMIPAMAHIAPESAAGGPFALVRTGDEIELNVPARTLTLHVSDEDLARRRAAWTPSPSRYERGYGRLLMEQITQADVGCDFRFLSGTQPTPEPDIF